MSRRAGERETDRSAAEWPSLREPQIERADLLGEIMAALRDRDQMVAVTGPGGAGKTVLAAQACLDRRLRRSHRNGIVWLEAGETRDAAVLLATLAHRLGLTGPASVPATVERARELLQPKLAGKRFLIVVDNVSERAMIDAFRDLSPSSTVMFTSRVPELAAVARATRIRVGGLSVDQSLELLGRRTGRDVAELPPEAEILCARSGGLALAVTLVAGMVGSRSIARALERVERLLGRAEGASGTPSSGAATLPCLIEAGIAAMPKALRSRYEKLAVFAGRGAFPADAAQALWYRKPHAGHTAALLEVFVSRGMLTARGADWYAAHDLHYHVLKGQLGDDELAAAHSHLLGGYRIRYRNGWTESAADPYLARNLAGHLRDAGLSGELRAVLINPEWIQARLARGPVHELIQDYKHTVDPLTRQVMRTLRREAPSLAAAPELVRPQLSSRLLSHPDPGITAWAAGLNRGGHVSPARKVRLAVAATPATMSKQILTGHTGPVRSVAVSEDGTQAVSGSDDGTVRLWDLTTGTERATLTGHTDWVRAVAISHDGTRAVSGSDDGTIRLWDLVTRTGRATLTGHDGEVFAVAITPDGEVAVSGGSDRILRIWDLNDGSERTMLAGHTRPVWSVAVVANTRAVSASGDGTIRVWDLVTGTERAVLTGHAGEVFALAITPDGKRAVSGGGDGTIRQWSKTAGLRGVLTGHSGWVRAVALGRDTPLAVSGGEDASVRVWDLTAGTERATLTGHDREVFSVAITPGGDCLVSGGSDGSVRVWDLTAIGRAYGLPSRILRALAVSATPLRMDV